MIFTSPLLRVQTAKTASFTAEKGKLYPVNLGSVTADLVLTFPSSPSANDIFGVYVSATHASGGTSTFDQRPFFCIEPADSTSIDGSSYSAKSGDGGGVLSLWLTGDLLIFMYDGSTWLLVEKEVQRHSMHMKFASDISISNSSATDVDFDTVVKDNASLHSTTSEELFYVKREGEYTVGAELAWDNSSTGNRYYKVAINSETVLQDRYVSTIFSEGGKSTPYLATAGTSGAMSVEQGSGGNLNLLAGLTFLRFVEM